MITFLYQKKVPYSQGISYIGRLIKKYKIKPEKNNDVKQCHTAFIKLTKAQIKHTHLLFV